MPICSNCPALTSLLKLTKTASADRMRRAAARAGQTDRTATQNVSCPRRKRTVCVRRMRRPAGDALSAAVLILSPDEMCTFSFGNLYERRGNGSTRLQPGLPFSPQKLLSSEIQLYSTQLGAVDVTDGLRALTVSTRRRWESPSH
jgi:hypothetical protein